MSRTEGPGIGTSMYLSGGHNTTYNTCCVSFSQESLCMLFPLQETSFPHLFAYLVLIYPSVSVPMVTSSEKISLGQTVSQLPLWSTFYVPQIFSLQDYHIYTFTCHLLFIIHYSMYYLPQYLAEYLAQSRKLIYSNWFNNKGRNKNENSQFLWRHKLVKKNLHFGSLKPIIPEHRN